MEQHLKLNNTDGDLLHDPSSFRRLVGRLIYLTISRPNIVFPVNLLSQFMHQPRQSHYNVVVRVFRYLKASPGQGLYFPSINTLQVLAYSDSD
jgi:hypothetical protein